MVQRSVVHLCLLLSISTVALGQTMDGYSGSSVFNLASNTADCTTGNVNCWHLMKMDATKIFSVNGSTIAIDSSGYAWLYDEYPTNTWTKQTAWGSGISEVEAGGDGNYYALRGSTCGTDSYYIYKWSGSAWDSTGDAGCYQSVSYAPDGSGDIVGIGSGGLVYTATGFGTSGATQNGTDTALSVSFVSSAAGSGNDEMEFYVVTSANKVVQVVGSTWTEVSGGATASQVSVDAVDNIYVIGAGSAGTSVYYNPSGSWVAYAGSGYTFLANGGPKNIWTIGPSSGGYNVYRMSPAAIVHTRYFSGISPCAPSCPANAPNGDPIVHNAYVRAGWGSANGKANTYGPFFPNTALPSSFSSAATLDDLFDCFDQEANCCAVMIC